MSDFIADAFLTPSLPLQGRVDNMLMQGESLDLNTVQSYVVPLKESLRKTMLDQEIMFKKQVQELHRLYGMQKILMNDIGLKQFDICTQSTWLFYSNPVRRESSVSLIEDGKLSSTAMVLPDRHNGGYNSIPLKPLGLQLCLDQHASYVDQEVQNLSLSGVHEYRSMNSYTSIYLDKKDSSCTKNIIDLEESSEGKSNEKENYKACTPTVAARAKCESEISVHSGKMEQSSIPFDDTEYTSGFRDCHKAFTVSTLSLKNGNSCEAGKLDLNQVQLDHSSCYSTSDNLVTCHSSANSLHIFGVSFSTSPENIHPCSNQRKESIKSTNDASNVVQWDDAVNSVVIDSKIVSEITDPKCDGIKGCKDGLTSSMSVTKTQVGSWKEFSCSMSDPENNYTRSTWELSVGQFTEPDATQTKVVNYGNTKDDEISHASQTTAQEIHEDGNVPPSLFKSICVDSSGSMKDTQPLTNLGDTNLIAQDQHLGTGDDDNELGHDCPKQVELPEVSMCIQTAAQLLISFSLGSSSSYPDCSAKAESIKVGKKEIAKIQCSDSYEQIALELEECNVDDCSASSKPYEIDSMEKKDFSFSIKRGRRFKDFQKEILPGIASLSRHEIQEDINILEAVLRSREYRKINARIMSDQRSWCVPMKSRRSKRNYVRRKLF